MLNYILVDKLNVLFEEDSIKQFYHKILPNNFYSYNLETFSDQINKIKIKI
jgi:hypothetical protein